MMQVPAIGAYSSISDQVLGFDRKMLTSAFNVGDEVVEEMLRATRPSAIVHALPEKKKSILTEIGSRLIEALIGTTNGDGPFYEFSLGKKKHRTYNILEAEHDFENCNGWSVTADKRDLKSLRHSNIGIFMVNLTKGSMMGPHWNPMATEIGIVLQGEGMIRVVCSSNIGNAKDCKNKRFRVKEGDVFTVPRFHPMAQMSFNNDTFVFMGFSTSTRKNYPQFLAGKSSVLQTLNRDILAMSFNVTNSTIGALLSQQDEAVILECTSCAEEEEMKMVREEEERKRKEEEEERKRKEKEEEKKREEEEREREEAEAEEREEERKRKEEEKKREEEEREREEAEAKERKRKEEEEERERREEEERKRKEKEEEEREREADAKREEEQRKREERAKREQEEARREQEERKRKRRQREKEEQERKERERKRQEEEGSGSGEGQQEEEIRRRIMAARRLWKA